MLPLYKDIFAEILVVDQNSDDDTPRVVRTNGCRIESTYNWGFCEPSKNYAAFMAYNEWILSLDADETLSESALKQLASIDTQNHDCYYLIRKTGERREKKLRLFRRGYAHCHPLLHRDFNPHDLARVGDFYDDSIIHDKTDLEHNLDKVRYQNIKEIYAGTPVLHQVMIRENRNK